MQFKLSFQQIEYFLSVAETLSFTEAAQNLYISQPALSKQITVIEDELGFDLFIRDRRHVSLTPEGAMLFHDWKKIEKDMEQSIYNAQKLRENAAGKLVVGCSDAFEYTDFLPDVSRAYMDSYPEVEMDIFCNTFKELTVGLTKDKIDLLIMPFFEIDGMEGIRWMKLREIPLSFVISKKNPLSKKESLTFLDLKDEKFVLISPRESVGGAAKTEAACLRCGLKIRNARYVPNVASMKLAVQNNLGIAVCNPQKFEYEEDICKIFPLPIQMEDSFLVAAWKKERKNNAMDLFINMLHERFPNPVHDEK